MLPEEFATGHLIDSFSQIENARQNPARIGLDNWDWFIEGECSDRIRRVPADAWKFLHCRDRAR